MLERDGVQDKKLLARLTIYHRPCDDAHIGQLYLDHDYVEDKSRGATCQYGIIVDPLFVMPACGQLDLAVTL